MRNTPRAFVGTVMFRLENPVSAGVCDAVERQVGNLSGVSFCDFDEAAGLLIVTAREPVERADVLALLDRLDCRVAQ
ncbi:hypothetical protein GCM10009843_31990 [Nocardioides bigeumensis]|uniref:Heavy-metal-associated domain-containing protein n=2 Tax=Nocardioides bigeumensis TaxID=433657 RepID=A0ABP5KGU8_9ACTN